MLAYAIAAVCLGPYIYYLLAYRPLADKIMPINVFSNDLGSMLVPTPLNELGTLAFFGRIASSFKCHLQENAGYLSPPLIVIAALFAHRFWREAFAKMLVEMLLILLVFSLGPKLYVFGRVTSILLPWAVIARLPLIKLALPVRLMQFVFLGLSIITSMWLSDIRLSRVAKIVIATITIGFLLPNLSSAYWTTEANIPGFFSAGIYRDYLPTGENVIIIPYGFYGDSMLWQAESGMAFNMVGGNNGFPPSPTQFEGWPVVESLIWKVGLPDAEVQLKSFLAYYDVGAVIVADDCFCNWMFEHVTLGPPKVVRTGILKSEKEIWHRWFATLGVTPVRIGGILLYKVPRQEIAPYKSAEPLRLKSAALESRFETLLRAGARYIEDGHDPAKLTPFRAKELKLIPAEWISDYLDTPDFKTLPLVAGMVLSSWDNGQVAVGVMGPLQSVASGA
jgi:hypothetical protein